MQTKYILYLSRFDFTLKHVAGKSMGQVDSLSKRKYQTEKVERDNENQVMLKEEWLEIRVMEKEQLLIEKVEEEIIEKIKKLEAKNDKVVKVVEEMKKTGVKLLRNDEQQIEDDLVLKEGKVYVLRDEELRLEIIWLNYNIPIARHERQ